jgi:hypothetical protein
VRRADGRTGLPWRERVDSLLERDFGDSPEAERLGDIFDAALTAGTTEVYSRHFLRFARYCEERGLCPLPASTTTVLKWLGGDVCRGQRVQAKSLQPYLSAINTLHADCEFEEPAVGRRIRRFKQGLGHLMARGRGAARTYAPATVVERAREAAMAMSEKQLRTPSGRKLLQALVATVFTFVFFARGGSGAALRAGDVRPSDAGLQVTLGKEKTRYSEAVSRVVTLDWERIPGLRELLLRWEAVRGEVKASASYYALPGQSSFPSTQVDAWVKLTLDHVGATPPRGETWSGHSLRKGAASAANAIGVSLAKICHVGGWSVKASTVHDYIDPTCPSSDAARRYFGWMLPR